MQLIVARWQITVERRMHTSRTVPPDTDLLEQHVAHLRRLQATEQRREWVQNWLTMHGDPYELPRD
jgi:hypothetical protein